MAAPATQAIATRDRFPRALVWAVGGLVGFVIVVSAIGSWTGAGRPTVFSTPVAVRYLRFTDRPDGGVAIVDTTTGRALPTVTGQSGFLRATLRGLASARKRAGIDATPPFRLTAWKDGRLTLDDDSDGRHVELEAFGPTNEAVFAALLTGPEASP